MKLKTIWFIIGVILVIQYIIPLQVFYEFHQTFMPWSEFESSFTKGLVFLLPALCGILLLVQVIVFGNSKITGLIITIAGLFTLCFINFSSSNHFSSHGGMNAYESIKFYKFLAVLSFPLVLTASKLKTEYEQSKIVSLFGGITGSIFLILILLIIIQMAALVKYDLTLETPFVRVSTEFLITPTWIIAILCSLGWTITAVLAVINSFHLPSKITIANYGFKIGFFSVVILIVWIIIVIAISAVYMGSISDYGVGWEVLSIYRNIFVFLALLLMLATGTYGWLKHYMEFKR